MGATGAWGAIVLVAGDGSELASWSLDGEGLPDLSAVDELARLVLAARRLGWSIRVRSTCPELIELLDLAGLGADVAPSPGG